MCYLTAVSKGVSFQPGLRQEIKAERNTIQFYLDVGCKAALEGDLESGRDLLAEAITAIDRLRGRFAAGEQGSADA